MIKLQVSATAYSTEKLYFIWCNLRMNVFVCVCLVWPKLCNLGCFIWQTASPWQTVYIKHFKHTHTYTLTQTQVDSKNLCKHDFTILLKYSLMVLAFYFIFLRYFFEICHGSAFSHTHTHTVRASACVCLLCECSHKYAKSIGNLWYT